jgi:hypothetical protein
VTAAPTRPDVTPPHFAAFILDDDYKGRQSACAKAAIGSARSCSAPDEARGRDK